MDEIQKGTDFFVFPKARCARTSVVIDALAIPTIGDPFARNGPGVVIELPVLPLRGAWAYGVVMLATANVEPKRVKNWISILRPGWYVLRAGITAILAKHASWAASCFGGSYPALVPKACILGPCHNIVGRNT